MIIRDSHSFHLTTLSRGFCFTVRCDCVSSSHHSHSPASKEEETGNRRYKTHASCLLRRFSWKLPHVTSTYISLARAYSHCHIRKAGKYRLTPGCHVSDKKIRGSVTKGERILGEQQALWATWGGFCLSRGTFGALSVTSLLLPSALAGAHTKLS